MCWGYFEICTIFLPALNWVIIRWCEKGAKCGRRAPWVAGKYGSTSLKCSHITIEPLISFTGKTIDNSQYLLPPASNQGNPSDLANTEQLPSKNIHSMGMVIYILSASHWATVDALALAVLGHDATLFKSCLFMLWLIWRFVLSCFGTSDAIGSEGKFFCLRKFSEYQLISLVPFEWVQKCVNSHKSLRGGGCQVKPSSNFHSKIKSLTEIKAWSLKKIP